MDERRLLNTFTAKNVSGEDLKFELQMGNGMYIEQTMEAGEVVRGLTRHARSLLWPWYEQGHIIFTQEWEYLDILKHDWRMEGF